MSEKYHLFYRDRAGKDKKTVRRWYYWYWGENGARIKKAAGPNNHAPLLKRDAQEYVDRLDTLPLLEASISSLPSPYQPAYGDPLTFEEFANGLFLAESDHLKRRTITDGAPIKESTRTSRRAHLDNYLIPKWGKCRWSVFEDEEFGDDFLDWLVGLQRIETHKVGKKAKPPRPLSNSLRNSLTETMSITLKEAKRKRLLRMVPTFTRLKRFSKHQDTLSNAELAQLFPEDIEELKKIWTLEDGRDKNTGIVFGAMCCLAVSVGLRSGEDRAVEVEKIIRIPLSDTITVNGLIVDQALDEKLKIVDLKKATAEDERARVVIIPDRTMRILDMYLETIPQRSGLLFLHRGKPIRKETLGRRWRAALKQAHINTAGRKLTPHALRYTYSTRMKMLLAEQIHQEVIGHRSEEMTKLYDRPHLIERIMQLSDQRESFNKFTPEFSGSTIEGDASSIDVLRQAGISHARAVISATNDDNVNLMIAQIAKEIYEVPIVIAMVNDSNLLSAKEEFDFLILCPHWVMTQEVIKDLEMKEG